MIEIDIRRKSFEKVTVLENVRFQLAPGELVCLLGPSGCGKTTLLNLLAGLDTQFEGNISPSLCTYMFQEPRLLPWRSLRQNLELVRDDAERIDELLELCALSESQHQFPTKVSLGMQRRTALARCLLMQPQLILMDEPMVSLDKTMADTMRHQIQLMRDRDPNLSILYVTHDINEAHEMADRFILLDGHPSTVASEVQGDTDIKELRKRLNQSKH